MAVSYVSSGSAVYSTSNPSPTTPTHNVNDFLLLTVGTKPDTTPATAPAGWTSLGSATGGAGTTGIDTGPMRVGLFYRIADGSASDTTGAITITGNNVSAAQVHVFRNATGYWDFAGVGAADTAGGITFTATMPSNPDMTVGDMLFAIGVTPTDAYTGGTAGAIYSSENVTATGMTTVNLTEITEWTTSSGQDMGGWLAYGPVVTGTATAAPVVTATASGTAAQSANVAGPIYLVRLRELTITSKSASESNSLAVTSTTQVKDGVWQGGGSSGPFNIALYVSAPGTPNTDDVALYNAMTGAGHTVTYIASTSSIPNTGYDLAVIAESGSSSSAANVSSATTTLPVIQIETSLDRMNFTTTGTVGTSQTAGTAVDITDNAHQITTGLADPLTWASSSKALWTVAKTALASGVQSLADGPSSTTALAIADAGATLANSATAPNRRAFFPMGIVPGNVVAWATGGTTLFTRTVAWAAGGGGQWVFPDSIAGSESNSLAVSETSSVDAITLVDKTASDGGSLAVTSTTDLITAKVLPGSIDGVEPEAANGWEGPFVDGNGNLYRVVEDYLGVYPPGDPGANTPRMMKSSDGGQTWAEVDRSNRPGAYSTSGISDYADMEAAWLTQDAVNKRLWLTWTKSSTKWQAVYFRTSDHPTNPDTWNTASGGNPGGSLTALAGVDSLGTVDEVAISSVVLSNGNVRTFVRVGGTNQQLLHRLNTTGTATWNTSLSNITESGVDITKPGAVLGSNDVTYLFYHNRTNGRVHYRTVASDNTVSAMTRVDTNGTGTGTNRDNNLVNPVFYSDAGTDVATVGWVNASNQFRTAEVRGGSVGTELAVSSDTVTLNPDGTDGTTGTEGPSAALAVYGTTLYALWGDNTSGDLYYATKTNGGTWSARTLLADTGASKAVHWLNANVISYGGSIYLAYTYDVGPHSDATGNILYNEMYLGADTGGTNKSGSESNSLAVSETTALTKTIVASESNSLAATDVSSGSITAVASESNSLAVSEVSNVANTMPGSESVSVAVAETSSISVTQPVSESNSLSVADTSAVLKQFSASESNSLAVAETSSGSITASASETNSLAASDIGNLASTLPGADSTALAVAETTSASVTGNAAESNSLAVGESVTISVTQPASDTSALAVTETTTGSITAGASESNTLSVTDISNVASTLPGTETIAIGIAESIVISVTNTSTDIASLSVTELSATAVSSTATDTTAISVSETAGNVVTLATADTGGIGLSDTSSATSSEPKSTTDNASLSVTEITSFSNTVAATESNNLAVSDTAVVGYTLPGTDSSALAVSDSSSLVTSGGADKSGIDSSSIAVTESSTKTVTGLVITTSDASTIAVSESAAESITQSATDGGSLAVGEATASFRQLTASDSTSVIVAETVAFGQNDTVAADSSGLAVTETSTVFIDYPGADTGSLAVAETSSIEVGGVMPVAGSDSVAISLGEETLLDFFISADDSLDVVIDETTSADVTAEAFDEIAVSVSEDASFFQDYPGSDNVVLAVSEEVSITTFEGMDFVEAVESFSISLGEVSTKYTFGTVQVPIVFASSGWPGIMFSDGLRNRQTLGGITKGGISFG